jgi:hypothetical protein
MVKPKKVTNLKLVMLKNLKPLMKLKLLPLLKEEDF